MEQLQYKLTSPQWPAELFGPIDHTRADRGRKVFDRTCALCHETYAKTGTLFLEYDIRVQDVPNRRWGFLSSALMGVFFSAGWSPCVGPVLGAILTLALNGGSLSQGAIMLAAYSLGLAIPFLLAAMGIGWVSTILSQYGKVMHYVEVSMGVVMVGVGLMLFSGVYEIIAQRFQFFWIDFGI
jgi:cytochrome c-type biogenesis protein